MDVGMAISDSSVLLYASDGWFTKLVQMWDSGGSIVEVDVGDGIGEQGELVFFDRAIEQRVAVFAPADLGVIMAFSAHPAAADHP